MGRYLALIIGFIFLVGFVEGVAAQDEPATPTEKKAAEAAGEAAEEAAEEMAEEPGAEEEAAAEEAPEEAERTEPVPGGGIFAAMDRYLQSGSTWLDNNKLFGKIRFTPEFGENIIYDSNIFLNDDNEPRTQGVEDDIIFSSHLNLAAVMGVNKAYTKIFDRDRITLLEYDLKSNNYLDHSEVSNLSQNIRTDLFGFLSDLLDLGVVAKNLHFRVYGEFSDLTDPLDLEFRSPFIAGFPIIKKVDSLRRQDLTAGVELGYSGNRWDVTGGYEYYRLEFSDNLFDQAEHIRNTGWIEFGMDIPGMKGKRVFARAKYSDYRFTQHLLNDADVSEGTIGFEGSVLTKKVKILVEGSYLNWDHQNVGSSPDESDYTGGIGWGRAVYIPMEQRKLVVQVEGGRKVDWSAISNYRVDDSATLTVRDEIMPDRLDADITLYWSHHRESEGPRWTLWELGAGAVYHLHRQVDATFRFLYRIQQSKNEVGFIDRSGPEVIEVQTNGDFDQFVVSLGINVRF